MEVIVHNASDNVSEEVSEEANASNLKPVSFESISSFGQEDDKVLVSG